MSIEMSYYVGKFLLNILNLLLTLEFLVVITVFHITYCNDFLKKNEREKRKDNGLCLASFHSLFLSKISEKFVGTLNL